MNRSRQKIAAPKRLTVTLAPKQRSTLERIATRNQAPLAFIVRYALNEWITRHADGQLLLSFPSTPE
jgi:hypothetical protein